MQRSRKERERQRNEKGERKVICKEEGEGKERIERWKEGGGEDEKRQRGRLNFRGRRRKRNGRRKMIKAVGKKGEEKEERQLKS